MIEQPITIYFDLQPDARPTIGSIGRAMVEFEKMAGNKNFNAEFFSNLRTLGDRPEYALGYLLASSQPLEWL